MPKIYLSAADGYSVQLASNNQSTIIAWLATFLVLTSDAGHTDNRDDGTCARGTDAVQSQT
jgi:hypothetical protein